MEDTKKQQPSNQPRPLSESNDYSEVPLTKSYPTQDVSNTYQPPSNPHRNDGGGDKQEQ